jgi:hypothetical protein
VSQASWGPGRTPIVHGQPADPWAGHTMEARVVADRRARRPIFGFVYELKVRAQEPSTCKYVGKCEGPTPKAVAERVHGTSGSAHTSPQSIAKDQWKADILPGRDGWRILERVYATGDDEHDNERLRRAEADWIDRKRPTENTVRPVRPFGARPHPKPRVIERPRRPAAYRPPTARELKKRAQRRRARAKAMLLAVLALAGIVAVTWVINAMRLPWPAVTWTAGPAIGAALGWMAFEWLLNAARKVTR